MRELRGGLGARRSRTDRPPLHRVRGSAASSTVTARTRQPGDRLVLLVGLALTASVFIPWYVDPETQMTWDQPTGVPWIVWVAPWLGFPILLSAFLKPHWARPLLLLSGAALVASMIGVVGVPSARPSGGWRCSSPTRCRWREVESSTNRSSARS